MQKGHLLAALAGGSILLLGVAAQAAADTTIVVAHRQEQAEANWMQFVKAEFEKAHPDIHVQLIAPGNGGDFVEKLTPLWIGGSFPDVFYGTTDKRVYLRYGWVADLTPYFNRDKAQLDLSDFFPTAVEVWNIGGKQYGMPISVSAQGLFYNRDKMQAAGLAAPPVSWDSNAWSWATMEDYARKLTVRDGQGVTKQYGIHPETGTDVSWAFGGRFLTPDSYTTGIPQGSALLSPQNIEAFTQLTELMQTEQVAPPADSGLNWSGFMNGTVAMEWSGQWKVRNYINSNLGFSFGFAPPPKVTDRVDTLFNDPWFMSSTTKHPEASWEFIKFATSKAALAKYAEMVGMPPARRSSFGGWLQNVAQHSGTAAADIQESFIGSVNHGRYKEEKVVYFGATIGDYIGTLLDPIIAGKIAVKPGLETADQQLNTFIKELMTKSAPGAGPQ